MTTLQLRVLTTDVDVSFTAAPLDEHLEALAASYARAGEAACGLSYRLEPGALWRDGALVRRTESPLDVLAVFELDLYRSVVELNRAAGWLVHGASVELDSRALLLAGASGAGKSTLTLALLREGAGYLSDECSLVTDHGLVYGMRRPISFDRLDGSLPRGFRRMSYPIQSLSGEARYPVLLHPPPEQLAAQPLPLGTIVSLRHAPDERPCARRLSSGEALCALWPQALSGDARALEAATETLSRYPVFELVTRTVPEACAMLRELHDAA